MKLEAILGRLLKE